MSKPARRKRMDFDNRLPPRVHDEFVSSLAAIIREDDSFKGQYQHSVMLSKYCETDKSSAKMRRDAAIAKFLSVELRNQKTNLRIATEVANFGWATSEDILVHTRKLVSQILGPLHYPAVLSGGVFSNGASTDVRRSEMAALHKLGGPNHVSSSALQHWFMYSENTVLRGQTVELRESSVLFTVPKSAEIDRVAAKEPSINALLQRGVGLTIRERLRRHGCDLRDQTVNQRLAEKAFERGLATIDLSSASDTVTRQLVYELLPPDWVMLLDDLRVKSIEIPRGKERDEHQLEMFSSMGNGFTFELESLIFYALTRVVCKLSGLKGTVSVYGDDIIAPKRCVVRLRNVFHFFGFTMNSKKTHARGYFRESCGKHYHKGVDVSPFYIRERIGSKQQLILILNELLEWDGRGWGFFQTEALAIFHRHWSRFIDTDLHGGIDVDDPSALVTGDEPRKRLVPVLSLIHI